MKVKFFTLGCKVNQYETQGLKEKFISLGCQVSEDKADLYVINSCTVTQRADAKSKGIISKLRKENPKAKIAVSGCLAQLNQDSIEKIGVDYVIPQEKKHLLPEIVLGTKLKNPAVQESLMITYFSNHRAFVKVQDGCNNFCTFCKIPYLRGKPKSKPKELALKEIESVSRKHKEVVLCGVNLSLYGRDLVPEQKLEELVNDILLIPHLGRLRLSSLEPFFLNDSLFNLLSNDKLCSHFHFPFQSGDDKVLKAMNKKETVSLYEEKVFQARAVDPNVAISCDIMVGFPWEDDKSFQNTVNFLNRVKPMRMHIFTFSPRENTPLHKAKLVDTKTVRKRYDVLRAMANDFSLRYKQMFLGKTLHMVAEERNNGYVFGYTENYIKVAIKDKVHLGDIVLVKINEVAKDSVLAKVCI